MYLSRQFRHEMSSEWHLKVNALSIAHKNSATHTLNLTNSGKHDIITHLLNQPCCISQKHHVLIWP